MKLHLCSSESTRKFKPRITKPLACGWAVVLASAVASPILGQETATWELPSGPVIAVAFSPDGKMLAATTASGNGPNVAGELRIWSVTRRELLATPTRVLPRATLVEFGQDSKTVMTCSGACGPCACMSYVETWDLGHVLQWWEKEPRQDGGELPKLERKPGPPWYSDLFIAIAMSADRKTLAASTKGTYSQTPKVMVWDLAPKRERFSSNLAKASTLALSPDGQTLAVGTRDRDLFLVDTTNGQVAKTLEGTHNAEPITFSPDGSVLAAVLDAGEAVLFWDAASGQKKGTIENQAGTIRALVFSPDGKWIACVGSAGEIKLWDVGTHRELAKFKARQNAIWCMAVSPDGKILATGTGRTVKLWDVADVLAKGNLP